MAPAEGKHRRVLPWLSAELLVGAVAIALQDAVVLAEQRMGVMMRAAGGIAIDVEVSTKS